MNDNFLKAMVIAGETYGREIDKNLVEIYAEILAPRDLDECAVAIKTHMTKSVYFPKPCDIINCIEGNEDEKATAAWHKVYSLLDDSQKAKTDDSVIEKVVKSMGGWHKLGVTDYEQLRFTQHEFVKNYKRELRHKEHDQLMQQIEHDNQKLIDKEDN